MNSNNLREKYNRLNNQLWQRSKIDKNGRLTLPRDLRLRLGIDGKKAVILWIMIYGKKDRQNEFVVDLGVKKS